MNRRREVLAVLGAVPWSVLPALGAQPKVLGALDPFPDSDASEARLRYWLKKLRYPEAETLTIAMLRSNGQDELLPRLAKELVALQPGVILTWGDLAARAVQMATTSIPIVVLTDSLIGAGKAASNVTGISVMATELDAKRLELLAPLLPPRSTVMVLADPVTSAHSRPGLRRAAQALGVQLVDAIVRAPRDIQDALQGARKRGIAGVNVLASAVLFGHSDKIIEWVSSERLPAIFEWGFMADDGALIGYGPLLEPMYGRLMNQVMGLVRGGKVADFPIEQPTQFELAINLKTAKAIGVEIPRDLLLRADRVIR